MYVCYVLTNDMDMLINVSKSVCIRFENRQNAECVNLMMRNCDKLSWVKSCRYLGVYFVTGRICKCSFDTAKQKFYHSFNAVFGKIDRSASEEVVLLLSF